MEASIIIGRQVSWEPQRVYTSRPRLELAEAASWDGEVVVGAAWPLEAPVPLSI